MNDGKVELQANFPEWKSRQNCSFFLCLLVSFTRRKKKKIVGEKIAKILRFHSSLQTFAAKERSVIFHMLKTLKAQWSRRRCNSLSEFDSVGCCFASSELSVLTVASLQVFAQLLRVCPTAFHFYHVVGLRGSVLCSRRITEHTHVACSVNWQRAARTHFSLRKEHFSIWNCGLSSTNADSFTKSFCVRSLIFLQYFFNLHSPKPRLCRIQKVS